jgi:hypothetical protein
MKNLLAALTVLGLATTGVAFADDESKEDKTPETEDCSKLEGDAKTECEAKKAEPKAESKGGKGKSMKKTKDGNMEAFNEE